MGRTQRTRDRSPEMKVEMLMTSPLTRKRNLPRKRKTLTMKLRLVPRRRRIKEGKNERLKRVAKVERRRRKRERTAIFQIPKLKKRRKNLSSPINAARSQSLPLRLLKKHPPRNRRCQLWRRCASSSA